MKYISFLCLGTLLLSFAAAPPALTDEAIENLERYRREIKLLKEYIEEIKDINDLGRDSRVRAKVERRLSSLDRRISALLDEIERDILRYREEKGKGTLTSEREIRPISETAFRNLLEKMERQPFSDQKMKLLKEASEFHFFSVEQVKKIVTTFDFGSDRIEAVVVLYPRVIDLDNFFQIYDEFEFDSDKEALRKRLNR